MTINKPWRIELSSDLKENAIYFKDQLLFVTKINFDVTGIAGESKVTIEIPLMHCNIVPVISEETEVTHEES